MFVARRAGGWADTAVAAATSTRARYLITLVGAAVKSCYRRLKVAALCARAAPPFFYSAGAPPQRCRAPRNGSGLPLALTRRPGFAGLPSGASLGPQALHYFMLVGPHPHSLSLGGPASPGFPPAPRSGRRRYIILCSWGPTPT